MRLKVFLAALAMTGGVATAQVITHEASVIDNKGQTIGSAKLSGGPHATVIRLSLRTGALTPGWHGIHLHSTGNCSDHAKFQASKGHVNPDNKKHGLLNPDGPDHGDLPNIFANADGSVNAELATPTLLKALRDADGAALVIHANPDDHMAQPIGGAGARVACAVIK